MAQAVKWASTVILTVVIFLLVVWVGLLTSGWILPQAWSHSDQEALVLAAASLLGTATLGIGAWWAQRDPKQVTPATVPQVQRVNGTFTGNSGITGSNIGGDVNYD